LEVSYQDALSLAGEQSNTAALGALKTLGPPPYSPDELRNLGRWLVKLGGGIYGETTVWPIFKPIILAPGYSLIDIHKYKDGSSQAMTRVLGAIMNEDLHELGYDFEIPIFFFLGRYDHNTPSSLAEDYFNAIEAPFKKLIWFEQAGHVPMLAQPKRFARELIEQVLAVVEEGEVREPKGTLHSSFVEKG